MARSSGDVVRAITRVDAGVSSFFETRHVAGTSMAYHRHDLPYVTVVLEGSYIEVSDDRPQTYQPGAVIVHSAHEEHADHFRTATRCLNMKLLLPHDVRVGPVGLVDTSKDAQRPAWLDEVIRFDEWVEAVPLQEIAKRCGVHPTHFSREFRRHVGTTPSDHRRRARVELASKLLLQTDRTLAQVAIACGFTDQSHLNRAFAIELGMSPGQYRRSFSR